MNLVIDDAEEVAIDKKTGAQESRRKLGTEPPQTPLVHADYDRPNTA